MESVNRFETVTLHNWVVPTKQKPLYRARVCLKSVLCIHISYIITFDDWIMSKCYDLKYKLFEGDLRKIQIKETRVLYMSHKAISKTRSSEGLSNFL